MKVKNVVLVRPHIHKTELPFQLHLYDEWIKSGIKNKKSKCPTWRWLFHIIRYLNIPNIYENKRSAHIVLISGGSVSWGAWPDSMFYEIIPIIWDCWPLYYNRVFKFIERNKIRTIVVTAEQTAGVLKTRYPNISIMAITEGIKESLYHEGDLLVNRRVDLLEYGRPNTNIPTIDMSSLGYIHLKSSKGGKLFPTEKSFLDTLSDTKVTIVFPRSNTDPVTAGNIETLTQRYWENMLSRVVMIGRAPAELVNLIGYNPVIDIDEKDPSSQIEKVLRNINEYQVLVDKNRYYAIKYSPWRNRIKNIEDFLEKNGYII